MRYFLLLLLTAFTCATNAQAPVEVADRRDQIVRYDQVIPVTDGSWIFAGIHQSWWERQALFVSYSADGTVLWEEPGAGAYAPTFMAPMADHFIVAGPITYCSLPVQADRVERRNGTGGIEWSVLVEMTIMAMDIREELTVLVGSASFSESIELIILSGSGGQNAQWELPWEDPRAVGWALDGTVLTLFDGVIARWSDDGIQFQNAMIAPGALDLAVITAGDIRVLYNDRVVRFGSDLAAIDSVMLSPVSDARWMEFADGTLWITCEEDFASVHPVDGLAATFSNQPIDSLRISGSAVRDGLIMTAGTAYVDGRSSGVLRSFTTEGLVAEHDDDVTISIANVDTMFVTTSAPDFPNMMMLHAQVTLMVENKGSTDLETVLLNTQRTVGYCGADFGANAYGDTLQLAPGGTALIPMPLITYWPVDVALGESLVIEVCFVALAPNAKVDREPSDNSTCHTFDVLHTMISDREPFGGAIIAPMPFNDRFTVRLTTPPTNTATITLHDAAGRLLVQRTWPAGRASMEIDAAGLPVGVLVLKVHEEGQQLTRQLVRVP